MPKLKLLKKSVSVKQFSLVTKSKKRCISFVTIAGENYKRSILNLPWKTPPCDHSYISNILV